MAHSREYIGVINEKLSWFGHLNEQMVSAYLSIIIHMNDTYQPTVFNQIFSLVRNHTNPILGQLKQKKRVFDIESLFKIQLFAQMSWKISLRDIETWLQSNEWEMYYMNMDSMAHSTISYWNNDVNPVLFEKLLAFI